MTLEHKLVVSSLEVEKLKDDLEDIVKVVHWRMRLTDSEDGLSVETYGATGLSQPEADNFVAFESITEEQLLGWLEAQLPMNSLKENLENQLAEKRAPKVVHKSPPWLSVSPSVE